MSQSIDFGNSVLNKRRLNMKRRTARSGLRYSHLSPSLQDVVRGGYSTTIPASSQIENTPDKKVVPPILTVDSALDSLCRENDFVNLNSSRETKTAGVTKRRQRRNRAQVLSMGASARPPSLPQQAMTPQARFDEASELRRKHLVSHFRRSNDYY